MSTLVIVESPAKAKTINKFLGKDFVVRSSFGHVRDLPKKELGVDVKNDFEPKYISDRTKSKVIKELKSAAVKAKKQVLFATDEDREGEAISWHLAHILDIDPKETQRIVFHEITKNAILDAIKNPRLLDMNLVDAQQTRRILDRLVGYELSPFLWRKVAKGLSAGRVQSVAVRLVVEREREIQNFKPQEYWSLEGLFAPATKTAESFPAKLHAINDKKLDKFAIANEEQAQEIFKQLEKASYAVKNLEQKTTTQNPLPPFTTSTLQQAANNRLGFSAKQTMRLAQQLYEGIELGSGGAHGLITYMRTDSVNLSDKFLGDAYELITKKFGEDYAVKGGRRFKAKSKNAQEAHEAVRPTEAENTPEKVKPYLTPQQFRLYNLIWNRAVASQMAPAKIDKVTLDLEDNSKKYIFRATGQTVAFAGFLKVYSQKTQENILPVLKIGAAINCLELKPEQHFTEPPARYSDATLVKIMEEYGIGRPSTYAPTIATIELRGYVARDDNKRLFPKDIAFLVNDILVEHFPQIVDYKFTAQMEENLDEIARGEKSWRPVISGFYGPFKENLTKKDMELSKKNLTEEKTDEVCEKCGSPMVIKTGRYGKFLACSNYPTCKNTKKIGNEDRDNNGRPDNEQVKELTAKFEGEVCEKCGAPMAVKVGKYGPFLACTAFPKCRNIKNIESDYEPIACPVCGKGKIIKKRSRKGIFYACDQYPDCKTAFWGKPTGKKCDDCGSLMIIDKKGSEVCSNRDCGEND